METPEDTRGATGRSRTVDALRGLNDLVAITPDPRSALASAELIRNVAESFDLLAGLHADLLRGMDELRRVYGIDLGTRELPANPDLVNRLLLGPGALDARKQLAAEIQELKVHHAALLEGYHESAYRGSLELLREVDPAEIDASLRSSSIRLGPLRLSARFQPVRIQAIWESFLVRFSRLKKLDPADFERYYRDGFRAGYQRFCTERLGMDRRSGASASSTGESES